MPTILVKNIFIYSLNSRLFDTNNNLYIKLTTARVTPILCFVHIANPDSIPYSEIIFYIIF